MSEVSSGLKSINELLNCHFYIPSYQRGYRWSKNQVIDLLNDILEFHSKEKGRNEFYCLQPIVIARNKDDGKLHVVDGQQRLTTIHIILSFLEGLLVVLSKSKYQIEYQTRPGSASFLNQIDPGRMNENIDYYHIVQAHEAIKQWFGERDGSVRLNFLNVLLGSEGNNVRVIWYELGGNANPIEVFTRLNMGKIGLTNAELIKALFLSNAYPAASEERQALAHRHREITAEWDSYETLLRHEDFWGFLQNGAVPYDNHIELIFDLMADNLKKDGTRKDSDKYHTFRYFSNLIDNKAENTPEQWNRVKSTFQLLHDWFTDKRLYHLVGFLVSAGEELSQIVREAQGLTKWAFFELLRTMVGRQVSSTIAQLAYPEDRDKLRKVLLLFNILSILDNTRANLRFQFGRYKSERWDIEHIHSVASEMPASRAHQQDWLKEVASFTADTRLKNVITDYLQDSTKDREAFEKIYTLVVEAYSDDANNDINDISNLALLDCSTNRGYKNAVFPIKRKVIIEKDQTGTFVPLCTKNVFLKYYNKNVDQNTFWGAKDRETYKAALVHTIQDYLNGKNYE